jgi:excisionase family DNA binding protein
VSQQTAQVLQFPKRPGAERMLTAAELAELLGMSERWIAYRVKEGMPSQRYGRARRFRLTDVDAWLQRRSG